MKLFMCNRTVGAGDKRAAASWQKLNPDLEVFVFDDQKIESFFGAQFPPEYLQIFRRIPDGPIKADFWRVCVLYKEGGVYSDIDNVPLVPLKSFIDPEADLVTCSSYWDEMKFNFNPNFIYTKKNCSIMKKCMDWYLEKFKSKSPYKYWQWSIMRTFTDILVLENYQKKQGVYKATDGTLKVQILEERKGKNHLDAHSVFDNVRVFNNRSADWDHTKHAFIR